MAVAVLPPDFILQDANAHLRTGVMHSPKPWYTKSITKEEEMI